jgi:hypothetical protein
MSRWPFFWIVDKWEISPFEIAGAKWMFREKP